MKKKIEKKAYRNTKVTKKTSNNKLKGKSVTVGFKKEYLKSSAACRVTFRLPKEAAPGARNITIVGDFNSWNINETPMKRLKSGDFKLTLKLQCKSEYRFRYLIDGNRWENDWRADRYVPNHYGCDDSMVIV